MRWPVLPHGEIFSPIPCKVNGFMETVKKSGADPTMQKQGEIDD